MTEKNYIFIFFYEYYIHYSLNHFIQNKDKKYKIIFFIIFKFLLQVTKYFIKSIIHYKFSINCIGIVRCNIFINYRFYKSIKLIY